MAAAAATSRSKLWRSLLGKLSMRSHFYSSKVDFKDLRPMILKRIENRAKEYSLPGMVPVAEEVLKARAVLSQGISTLLNVYPIAVCKCCSEVFVGENGHLIQNCRSYKRRGKNRFHDWFDGHVNDVLVPVETNHLQNMFQDANGYHRRFNPDRVPAVIELCWQAGANPYDDNSNYFASAPLSNTACVDVNGAVGYMSSDDLKSTANTTLKAWEALRLGVQNLLVTYPAKVCKWCSEVHVGPSGHKAQFYGLSKFESCHGNHEWTKAWVDDLVPQNMVWWRRPQDPAILLHEGRDFYGHAPAVVALCAHAGAVVPTKYFCMMKVNGLSQNSHRNPSTSGFLNSSLNYF